MISAMSLLVSPVLAQRSGSSGGSAAIAPTFVEQHEARVREFESALEHARRGDDEAAIAAARKALAPSEDFSVFRLRWNDYVMANVAFWQGDLDALIHHRDQVAAGNDFSANEGNVGSLNSLIESLLRETDPAAARSPAISVPSPSPPGYSWVFVPGTLAALPRPDGWYVTIEEDGGTIACFITLENLQEAGRFETGLSLNFVRGVSASTGASASTYAASVIANLSDTYASLIEPTRGQIAPGLIGYGIRYRAVVNDEAVIVHSQLLADDTRDTVRFIVFESPEATWDAMWTFGEIMVSPWLLGR
jgi:hypothetical protein